MGSKSASTVLTAQEEALAVALRRHTLLPLDDCLYAWQEALRALGAASLFSARRQTDFW